MPNIVLRRWATHLAIVVAALICAAQGAGAQTDAWCNKYPSSPWYPSCVVDPANSGAGTVKYFHAVALPYRLWTRASNGSNVTYYGYVNDLNWKSTHYPCRPNISHQQDRADNPGVARFQGSTWACV